MISKLKEIAQAWIISAKPNPAQKKLAEERYDICIHCEHFGESRPITGEEYCKDCLCPLSKKIFTTLTHLSEDKSCPKDKWKDVEDLYWPDTQKKKKSIL
jgi:hypothetical protein